MLEKSLCLFILKSTAKYGDRMQDFIDVQYVINFLPGVP
jgi:hypothetical protein